jgi:protein PhnA
MMDIKVRDSNGAELAEGDSVTLIKDLKLKGSSTVLKRGTVIRNIHLTDDEDEIEGRTDKIKGLVLRTEFLKKAEPLILRRERQAWNAVAGRLERSTC